MDVQQILEWTDRLVLAKTGKHLNSLQQAVLTGVWQSRKYREIAHEYRCSEANIKKAAKHLWYLLSEELGEKVNKSNFRATMERYQISNFLIVGDVVNSKGVKNSINLCGESFHTAESKKNAPPPTQTKLNRKNSAN